MFSCIFRPSRQAAFAACKKAKQSLLTSPRGPKASRQKTSGLSNRRQTTCPERRVAAGHFCFEEGVIPLKCWERAWSQLQDKRRILSEARAGPPLVFGMMDNSSTVTKAQLDNPRPVRRFSIESARFPEPILSRISSKYCKLVLSIRS